MINKFIKFFAILTLLLVCIFISVAIYKEIRTPTLTEQKMHCLELGSNYRTTQCLRLIGK
jgi:hypothetical protein